MGNPILLGKAIDEKEYILDAKVELNDNMLLDLELQVLNDHDWPERSLHYLCRIYDSLHRGENYKDSKAAMHIGILNFKLHKDSPLLADVVKKGLNKRDERFSEAILYSVFIYPMKIIRERRS